MFPRAIHVVACLSTHLDFGVTAEQMVRKKPRGRGLGPVCWMGMTAPPSLLPTVILRPRSCIWTSIHLSVSYKLSLGRGIFCWRRDKFWRCGDEVELSLCLGWASWGVVLLASTGLMVLSRAEVKEGRAKAWDVKKVCCGRIGRKEPWRWALNRSCWNP